MNMQKVKVYAGIVATVFLLFFGLALSFKVFAGEDEVAKLQARIAQLQQEIENNGNEYKNIAASIATDRAHCDLASAKESQLAKLNGSNNAKRTEIEILGQLLSQDDSTVKLGK